MVLVETRCPLELLFGNIENEAIALRIRRECPPGNGEQPVAEVDATVRRKHGVSDPSTRDVENYLVHSAQFFTGAIDDCIAFEGVGSRNVRSPSRRRRQRPVFPRVGPRLRGCRVGDRS